MKSTEHGRNGISRFPFTQGDGKWPTLDDVENKTNLTWTWWIQLENEEPAKLSQVFNHTIALLKTNFLTAVPLNFTVESKSSCNLL